MTWKPHSEKQEKVLFSDKRVVVLACGIQFGKTAAGAIRMKMEMHKNCDPLDNFLIVAPTYKLLQQSTLPPFLRIMEGCGEYSKSDSTFRMFGGGTCYIRTTTDPDSLVGITNVRHIWVDEAGLLSLYAWEVIQGRAAFKQASIVLTTSPYALNWLYKDIIRPKTKDPEALPDIELVQARSDENPYFPKEEYENRKNTMDPRRFLMMFGGGWGKMIGLVYDCFDDEDNVINPVQLPTDTRYVAGVDFGYTHPFVIVVRAITPDGRHYQVAEFYRTHLTIDQKVEAAARFKSVYGISMFYCDPARPDDIASFNKAKLPAIGANNDIRSGIDRHWELIKARTYKIFKDTSPHTMNELEVYHYPALKDLNIDQSDKEQLPVDADNHCLDANRYVTMMTCKGQGKPRAVVPSERPPEREDQFKRLERLKRPSRNNQTERWS